MRWSVNEWMQQSLLFVKPLQGHPHSCRASCSPTNCNNNTGGVGRFGVKSSDWSSTHSFSLINQCCIFYTIIAVFSIFYIDVSVSDQVAQAVAMCGQAMPQLRIVCTKYIRPLLLLRALGDRECLLDHVEVVDPLWVCTLYLCGCWQECTLSTRLYWLGVLTELWCNALVSEVGSCQ